MGTAPASGLAGARRGRADGSGTAPSRVTGEDPAEGRTGRLLGALWLAYLFAPARDLVTRAGTPWQAKALGVGGLALFVAAYVWLMADRLMIGARAAEIQRRRVLLVALLVVLDLLLIPAYGPAWTPLSIFVAVMCTIVLPWTAGIPITLILIGYPIAVGRIAGWSRSDQHSLWTSCAAWLLVTVVVGLLVKSRVRLREVRAELARAAVNEAVAGERLRFSRDLHDLLGHSLTVIVVKSELATRLSTLDPAQAHAEVLDIERIAREALAGVRETVAGYRDLSLTAEIEGARAALSASGVSCVVHPAGAALPAPVEALFAWGVREGTTNILRHSNATECEIRLGSTETTASLEVLDNGLGPSCEVADGDQTDGTGLVGLAERFASVGGRVQTGSRPDGGFRLHAEVPIS